MHVDDMAMASAVGSVVWVKPYNLLQRLCLMTKLSCTEEIKVSRKLNMSGTEALKAKKLKSRTLDRDGTVEYYLGLRQTWL